MTGGRRWRRWSVVPSIAALAVAGTVLGRGCEVDRAADAYQRALADPSRAAGAADAFDTLRWPVWYDDEVAALGAGSASVLAGELVTARQRFETALAQSAGDRFCRAAVNLVLTIEAQGDEILELDAPSAVRFYTEAREAIDGFPDCRERRQADAQGAGDRLDRAAQRLDEKLAQAEPPSGDDTRPVSPEQTQSEPDESDLDQLDRALDENADTRSEGPELEDVAEIPPGGPRPPQW